MKILVIGSRIPWPLHDGGAVATYRMLQELSAQGHEVLYFSFNTKKHFVSDAEIKSRFAFCRVVTTPLDATPRLFPALLHLLLGKNYNLSRFRSEEANLALQHLLETESFDLVQFEGLFTVSLLPTVRSATQIPAVLRQHNAEYIIWEKLAMHEPNPVKKWYLRSLAHTLKKEEIQWLKNFDLVVPISHEDERIFKTLIPGLNSFVYQAGIHILPQTETAVQPHTLCHLGSMEWMPNVQGVVYFIEKIWPSVYAKFPEAQFHIAGKSLDKNDVRFQFPGVVNHGEAADANAFVNQFTAVVVPLQSGSGIRMKTIEAMALGKPVISTPTGAEGLGVTHGTEILMATELEEWMSGISRIFEDPEFAATLGSNARKFATGHFSADALTRNLAEKYESLIHKKSRN